MLQAAQKEAADARKMKKAKEAQRKHEKEITQRVRAGENRSDVESELESEDPTEVENDMIFSEEEESREVVATSTKRRDPAAMSTGGEQEAERRGDVPMPRKRAASAVVAGKWEVNRTRSPRPSVASTVKSLVWFW